MSEKRETHIVLSSVEADNVVHYRTVSRTAIASLLLGLLSAAAFVNKLMWCVPIVGVALAIVALRIISKGESLVLGRKAAQVGLALSLLFLTSATTGHLFRQRSLRQQARPHTSKWIEMVREGRLREAHQMYLPQLDRQKLGTNLQNYYEATREAREDKESFFGQSPLSEIVELGRQGQLRFEADEDVSTIRESGESIDLIVQRYAIDYEADGRSQTLSFLIHVTRAYDSHHGEARWRVREIADPDSDG